MRTAYLNVPIDVALERWKKCNPDLYDPDEEVYVQQFQFIDCFNVYDAYGECIGP